MKVTTNKKSKVQAIQNKLSKRIFKEALRESLKSEGLSPLVYERKDKGIQKITNVITGKTTYRVRLWEKGREISQCFDTYRVARKARELYTAMS